MLDADDVPPPTELELGPRTTNPPVGRVFGGVGLFLAVAFFPQLFNSVATYDDEGYFLVTVRQFLHHGSLYVHTLGTSYGPFYWSFIGLIYLVWNFRGGRVARDAQPTLQHPLPGRDLLLTDSRRGE